VDKITANSFSIIDNPIFQNLTAKDSEFVKNLFGLPEKMTIGYSPVAECAIIFIADGTLSLDVIDEDGEKFALTLFAENDLIAPTRDDLIVTVRSSEAYVWSMPYEKIVKLPAPIKNFLTIILNNQDNLLERITTLAPTDAQKRIKLFCKFMDKKSKNHIPLIDEDMASMIAMWREVVTKARKEINKAG
jgi:hypothetical protein